MTRGRRPARRLKTVQARDDGGLGSGRGIEKWVDSKGGKGGTDWIREGGEIKESLIHSVFIGYLLCARVHCTLGTHSGHDRLGFYPQGTYISWERQSSNSRIKYKVVSITRLVKGR